MNRKRMQELEMHPERADISEVHFLACYASTCLDVVRSLKTATGQLHGLHDLAQRLVVLIEPKATVEPQVVENVTPMPPQPSPILETTTRGSIADVLAGIKVQDLTLEAAEAGLVAAVAAFVSIDYPLDAFLGRARALFAEVQDVEQKRIAAAAAGNINKN